MKCEIIQKEKPKEFEPITIQLIIESQDELVDLWHRMNIGFGHIENTSKQDCHYPPFPSENYILGHSHNLWSILDNLCKKLNLKTGNLTK